MGLLDPNHAIGNLHGTVGDLVFVRTADGRIIVRHRPVREAPSTPGELANRFRFGLAGAYVKHARAQPELYREYELAALKTKKRACNLASADFWHPPVITALDAAKYTGQPGELIRIEATDDFGVIAVAVTIAGLDQFLIEQGTAFQAGNGSEWAYSAQVALPKGQTVVIHITATDRPGNIVNRSFDHALV